MRNIRNFTPRRLPKNRRTRGRATLDYKRIAIAGAVLVALLGAFVVVPIFKAKNKPSLPISPINPIDAEPTKVYTEQEAAIAVEGGQLQIYIPTNSPSLNVLLADTKEMQNALSLVYEKLIAQDSTMRYTPSLAESWEKADEQGLTWKISLRKDIYWQQTQDKLTAHDVIFTIGLLKSPQYAQSPYAYHIDKISGFEALDESTLLITAKDAGAMVLQALNIPIVSQKYFMPGKQPVGTGPYIMEYADKRFGLEFVANENWWRQTPYIKSIIARTAQDNLTALGSIELRRLNYVPSASLFATGYREIGETGILEMMSQQNEIMLINHNSKRLQDPAVRKAIAYGIDRREVIARAYLNHAFACDVPLPPDAWLYDSKTKVFDYNPAMAQELLSQAGWVDFDADGVLDKNVDGSILSLRLRLLVNDTPANQVRKDAATLIAAQLKSVGIELTISELPWTAEKDDYLVALSSGAFDLALAGFSMDTGYDLTPFIGTGGENNFGKYSSEQMDALLMQVAQSTADKDIKQSMQNLQAAFIEDLPFIQLYFRSAFAVYSETLKGIKSVRDTDVFAGIEKWNFDAKGREMYTDQKLGEKSDWASFDVDAQLPDPVTQPDVSPTPLP